jgi:hypothetical protein
MTGLAETCEVHSLWKKIRCFVVTDILLYYTLCTVRLESHCALVKVFEVMSMTVNTVKTE